MIVLTLSQKTVFRMFNGLGSFLYSLNLKHRRIIVKNLEFALGDRLTPEARENIAKQCYQRFLLYIANFISISNKDESYLRSIVTFENEHFLTDALARNEKIILVSAHYGHWELILQAVGAFHAPISTIGERLMNSAKLNDTLVAYRQKNKVEMFQKEGALVGVVKAMKKGRILAYLVDQNYKKGVEVSFFGKTVLHIQSASQLSRKFDALILPVFCTTEDFKNYTIRFQEPYKCIKSDDEEQDIIACTQRQADIIQKAIEERPYDYFWFHKKFKGKYPELYKNP